MAKEIRHVITINGMLVQCNFELRNFVFDNDLRCTNVSYMAYNSKTSELYIQYVNGKSYLYDGVKADKMKEYKKGENFGAFLADKIKGWYGFTQVDWLIEPLPISEFIIEFNRLRHEYDSTRGLWCIDKEPEDKTNFFQLTR